MIKEIYSFWLKTTKRPVVENNALRFEEVLYNV